MQYNFKKSYFRTAKYFVSGSQRFLYLVDYTTLCVIIFTWAFRRGRNSASQWLEIYLKESFNIDFMAGNADESLSFKYFYTIYIHSFCGFCKHSNTSL